VSIISIFVNSTLDNYGLSKQNVTKCGNLQTIATDIASEISY